MHEGIRNGLANGNSRYSKRLSMQFKTINAYGSYSDNIRLFLRADMFGRSCREGLQEYCPDSC